MTHRLLILCLLGLLLAGCSRGLSGTYVRKSPNGTLTLELANGGFKLNDPNNVETLTGSYTVKDNLVTLVIEERSGKSLPANQRAVSPPMLIKDGGNILEEESGNQFRKQ